MTQLKKIGDLTFKPYISADEIRTRIKTLGQQINEGERETHPVFLVIMTGAYVFAADLLRLVDIACEIRFVRVKSYEGTKSSGVANLEIDFLQNLKDRCVIIVEDIVDTGLTVHQLGLFLEKEGVGSLNICSLLSKPSEHKHPVSIKYQGFEIDNIFVVGYGLDYNDQGRNLPDIWQLA